MKKNKEIKIMRIKRIIMEWILYLINTCLILILLQQKTKRDN